MKKTIRNLSIGQNILFSTLGIVMIVLSITSVIFYLIFTKNTNQLVADHSREINKQIVLNYENYINDVIETANYIQTAALNLDVDKSYTQLQNIVFFNTDIKKDVVAIYLFDEDANLIIGDSDNVARLSETKDKKWFINAIEEQTTFHFSAPHYATLVFNIDNVISVSRSVEFLKGGVKQRGVILIEINFNKIINLSDKTNLGEEGHILILNDDDSLVYSSGPKNDKGSSESHELSIEKYLGGFRATINSKEMYININTLTHTRWRIVTVNNINNIALARRQFFILLVIISVVTYLLSIAVALYISHRISSPINQLRTTMLKIERGNFLTKVKVKGQKEVVQLSKSFNSMLERISSLMEEVVDEQRNKRKTELKALQNQINPHFLYNTLDSIVWLAENERTEDVITTVIALARFFRISISRGATYIPVKDEISHIENYLTIQKIRYVNKFEYSFDVADEIYNYKIMKLILQPIVENAIYHGVGDETELIQIKAYKDESFLYFEVENSGYGITEERIEEIYAILKDTDSISSVGMRNVYLRLKLYYGDKADIKISSRLDEMTNIKLIIPLDKLEEKND